MSSRANNSSLNREQINHQQLIDGRVLDSQESGALDVVAAIGAMNRAYQSWAKESSAVRSDRLLHAIETFQVKLQNSATELLSLLEADTGIARATAQTKSLPTALALLNRLLLDGHNQLGQPLLPVGHSALILGWSDPLVQFCRRVPAIMSAGAGLVVKPSRRASLSVLRLGELWSQALSENQIPPGLFSVLCGGHEVDDSVGALLLRHPSFKTVFWVGGTDTGLAAERIAIENSKRFQFSGSGRNSAIIFSHPESELDRLAEQVVASCLETHTLGPWRPSRLFVQESIYKAMLERLADRMLLARNPSRLPSRETARFIEQTRQALSETGHLVVGGDLEDESPKPTLIRDLSNCSLLQSQELSGPLLTITSFKYQHEALKYANTTPLGLCGYAVHPAEEKAAETLERLEAGVLSRNLELSWVDALSSDAAAVKDSGRGPQGLHSVTAFCSWRGTILPK